MLAFCRIRTCQHIIETLPANMLEDEEIRMVLDGARDIVEKAEALVKAANENGGKDNISVILIESLEAC